MVKIFRDQTGRELVETAFLELGQPDLRRAVERLVTLGADKIVVVPYFLTLGKHLQRDLPRIVEEIGGTHPRVEITVTPPLDGHPALAAILDDRVREAGVE
jgi:sirohydrochlorin ferrochelatase